MVGLAADRRIIKIFFLIWLKIHVRVIFYEFPFPNMFSKVRFRKNSFVTYKISKNFPLYTTHVCTFNFVS